MVEHYIHHMSELNWKDESIDQSLIMIDLVQVYLMVLTIDKNHN